MNNKFISNWKYQFYWSCPIFETILMKAGRHNTLFSWNMNLSSLWSIPFYIKICVWINELHNCKVLRKRHKETIGNAFSESCAMMFLTTVVQEMHMDCDDCEACVPSVLEFKAVWLAHEGKWSVITLLYALAIAVLQCKGNVSFQAKVKDLQKLPKGFIDLWRLTFLDDSARSISCTHFWCFSHSVSLTDW